MPLKYSTSSFVIIFALLSAATAAWSVPVPVGMEEHLKLKLPANLIAAPIQNHTNVIVRIEKHQNINNKEWLYGIQYTIMVAGKYDLRAYLLQHDGAKPDVHDAIEVEGYSILPKDFDGRLMAHPLAALPERTYYWYWISALGLVWIVAFIPLFLSRRKRIPYLYSSSETILPSVPTTLEKIRGLANQAQLGFPLSVEQQTKLESLLISYWREKRDVEFYSMDAAMIELRADPEAGLLLDQLGNWLHRPKGGCLKVNIPELLKSYATNDIESRSVESL